MIIWKQILFIVSVSCFSLDICHLLPIVLEVFSSSEFFHHHHLVLSHLRCDLKKPVLLFFLRKVDNTSPTLLVLGLEIPQELIE